MAERRSRAGRGAVFMALVALSCARGEAPGLPPMPPPVTRGLPAAAAAADFRLVADAALVGGEGLWLVAGTGEWQAVWPLPLVEEDASPRWSRGPVPFSAGLVPVAMPAGTHALTGTLRSLLALLDQSLPAMLVGTPGQAARIAGSVEIPDDADDAYDLALGLAVLESAAKLPPRLLGALSGALDEDRLGGAVLDLRLEASPPLAEPEWRQPWHLRGLPAGAAFFRLELPAAVIWPAVVRRLGAWALPAPPEPREDLALEAHLLGTDAGPALVLAMPAAWAPRGAAGRDLLAQGLPPVLLPALDLLPDRVPTVADGAGDFLVILGSPEAARSLLADRGRDRPLPFAELRHRWPRGTAGLVADLDALPSVLRQSAPFLRLPVPASGASGRILEVVAGAREGGLRVHATWPGRRPAQGPAGAMMRGLGQGAGSRVVTDRLAETLGAEALEAIRRGRDSAEAGKSEGGER